MYVFIQIHGKNLNIPPENTQSLAGGKPKLHKKQHKVRKFLRFLLRFNVKFVGWMSKTVI